MMAWISAEEVARGAQSIHQVSCAASDAAVGIAVQLGRLTGQSVGSWYPDSW